MDKDHTVYLFHILEAIENIENYMQDVSESDFFKNKMLQDAVVRNLEIISEATKRIPETIKQRHLKIEWKKIAGMRDVLIHDYLGVDYERVWMAIINRIPELKKDIQNIVGKKT